MSSYASSSHSAHSRQESGVRRIVKGKMERFTFTLGKLDAGMAILLGPNAHLLEFPSLLLPTPGPNTPPLGPGSILTITVSRDLEAEAAARRGFTDLQQTILDTYTVSPKAPRLRVRSVTQTSVVVDWDRIDVGSADFRSLEMYKNGQRWGRVGGDHGKREKREWKTGGLQVGEEYSFQLLLKTTAGVFTSNTLKVRTHTMDNLTGINIYFGPVQPPTLLQQLRSCLTEIGAKESQKVGIDCTHFVCTTPLVGGDEQGRGGAVSREYTEAIQMNLPVVGPGWLLAVAGERKLVPISSHLLPPMPTNLPTADPAPFKRPEPKKRTSLTFTSSAPSSPIREDQPRSPSPETIARMSMVSNSNSRSSSAKRSDSLEAESAKRWSVPVESRSGRESKDGSEKSKAGGADGRRSRESTYPLEAAVARPKSPKPEADGKLDRGFKFPLTSPTSASEPTVQSPSIPTIPSTATATEGASIEQAGNPASALDQRVPTSSNSPTTALSSTTAPMEVKIPRQTVTGSPVSEEPADFKTTASPPAHGSGSTPKASTIDEAISNFHDAVKTPKGGSPGSTTPESSKPQTPTIAINGEPMKDSIDLTDRDAESAPRGKAFHHDEPRNETPPSSPPPSMPVKNGGAPSPTVDKLEEVAERISSPKDLAKHDLHESDDVDNVTAGLDEVDLS